MQGFSRAASHHTSIQVAKPCSAYPFLRAIGHFAAFLEFRSLKLLLQGTTQAVPKSSAEPFMREQQPTPAYTARSEPSHGGFLYAKPSFPMPTDCAPTPTSGNGGRGGLSVELNASPLEEQRVVPGSSYFSVLFHFLIHTECI